MIDRCTNKNVRNYKDYGGRGISICNRWLSFENFYKDMGPKPKKSMSIDRIDNNGNYESSNCRWATQKEQCNNKRGNNIINYNGKTQTMTQWAEEIGIKLPTLHKRITKYGWSIKKAIETPTKTLEEIWKERCISVCTDRGELFESILEASIRTGANTASIRKCLEDKDKTTANRKWVCAKNIQNKYPQSFIENN